MEDMGCQGARTDGPDPLTFSLAQVTDVLWTLTERCNLECAYCEVIPRERAARYNPTRDEVDRVLDQLRTLEGLESLILSGGEALLSPHIEYVLARAGSVAPVRYLITNGTTVRSPQKRLLEKYRPRTMVSIDSLDEDANAATRGDGRIVGSIETVEWLLRSGIFTIVILVLTRHNLPSVRRTIGGLYDLGVRNVLVQQLHCARPRMHTAFLDMLPSVGEVHDLYLWLEEFRRDRPDVNIDDNEVCFFERRSSERAKKCRAGERYLTQRLFMCGAGYNFFALRANGDVIPCNAFLDVVVGNIHRSDIRDILEGSSVMQGLRNLRTHRVDEVPGCAGCPEAPICDGGCRADVFNLTGEIGNPHPCCPRHAGSYGGGGSRRCALAALQG